MPGWIAALISALFLAAVSTLGDFLWARFVTAHGASYGLLHGTIVCLAIGFALGSYRRRPLSGALGGAGVGPVASGSFYALAPLIGYAAMFVSWMGLWVGYRLVEARGGRHSIKTSAARSVLAAASSCAAFYAISGIWISERACTENGQGRRCDEALVRRRRDRFFSASSSLPNPGRPTVCLLCGASI